MIFSAKYESDAKLMTAEQSIDTQGQTESMGELSEVETSNRRSGDGTYQESRTSVTLSRKEEENDQTLSEGEPFIDMDETMVRGRGEGDIDAVGSKLKQELTKYKQELQEYNETTKDLEMKYMKINHELNEMQQKHELFVERHSSNCDLERGTEMEVDDTEGMDYVSSLSSIRPGIGRVNGSFMTVMEAPTSSTLTKTRSSYENSKFSSTVSSRSLRRPLCSVDMLEDHEDESFNQHTKYDYRRDKTTGEISQLYTTIKDLRSEQQQFRSIIRQQQDRITDYHSRCLKAQDIMKTQKTEIHKLADNNKQLESSIYNDFESLRCKIDAKLKTVSKLPQMMREEHSKYEKALRENCSMAEKLRVLQKEAVQLKAKIDELGKRKQVTINRLKTAERDLKIFKNYNTALKMEKSRISNELVSTKEQLMSLQANSKRQLARHREQSEKQRRELQKRIYDLELKLNRSQNSTSSLIQERDSLIAELQGQLHTLVHNFEVSQKHIRVLRRHIYTMTQGTSGISGSGRGIASTNNSTVRVNPNPNPNSNQSNPVRPIQVTLGKPLSNSRLLRTNS